MKKVLKRWGQALLGIHKNSSLSKGPRKVGIEIPGINTI